VTGIICFLGFFLQINILGHEYLKAKTLDTFLLVLDSCLAWPSIDQPLAAIVMYLPVLVFSLIAIKQRRFTLRALILVWVPALLGILNAVSIAYARGNGLPNNAPLSRYQEILALGSAANASALLLLKPIEASSKKWWYGKLLLCVTWCTLFILGAARLSMANFITDLPLSSAIGNSEAENLTTYVQTHDWSILEGRPWFEIGHPDARVIQQVIENPKLAPLLPTLLRSAGKPTTLEAMSSFLLRLCPTVLIFSLVIILYAKAREWSAPKSSASEHQAP
jgi:hypothetical protein